MHGRTLATLLAALADARQQLQVGVGGYPGSSSSSESSRPQASPSVLRRLLLSALVALEALLADTYEVRSRCVCVSVSGCLSPWLLDDPCVITLVCRMMYRAWPASSTLGWPAFWRWKPIASCSPGHGSL